MLNIALTGNAAAGKSTVGSCFARWGATLIDADELVRQVQAPGSAVLAAIAREFDQALILDDGTLDRPRLRRLVMADREALDILNAIVHPAVQRRRAQLAAEATRIGDCVVVNDIPLLFEVLDPAQFDVVVLVDAPVAVRRRRLVQERGLSSDEADRLMASQMDAQEKRGRSDFVIDNVGSVADLERASWAVWRALRERAAKGFQVEGGSLLAVLAHPDDEALALGGTLARYADAGVEVHVVSATAGETGGSREGLSDSESPPEARLRECRRASEILGVRQTHLLGYPDGGLSPDSGPGVTAVESLLRQLCPQVIITFGPDGATGHPDHKAVHHWTRAAWQACGHRGFLYYITYPQTVAQSLGGGLAGRPEEEIVAALDIRPWQDVKRAAIDAHASPGLPFDRTAPETAPLFEHEWFAGELRVTTPLVELFGTQSARA
jgi:dephospho-CoA kinase